VDIQTQEPESCAASSNFWERFGADVCKKIDLSIDAFSADIQVIKADDATLTMRVTSAEKSYFVKHRYPDTSNSRKPYTVEREALRILGPTNLAPRLLTYSDESQILVEEFIEGSKVRDLSDRQCLRTLCKEIGQWLRKYANKAPYHGTGGNWFEYLTHYPDLLSSRAVSDGRDFLELMTFERQVLSRNSGALSDLVLRPDGSIFCTKFDKCQFKPFGWDLLLTARSYCLKYPDRSEVIISQLAAGFCAGSKDAAARWQALLQLFVVGLVFETGTHTSESPAEMGRIEFNKTSLEPASIVATSPHLESQFVPQDQEILRTFRTHLEALTEEVQAKGPCHEPRPAKAQSNPNPAFSALCSGCQGECCRMGVGRNAFIEEHVVGRLLKLNPEEEPESLIKRYIQHVPSDHVSGSCFYHGPKGCSLPREMRSDICNRYACGSARNLLRKIEEAGTDNVLCIAGHGRNIKKAMRSVNGQVSEVPLGQVLSGREAHATNLGRFDGDF
jgi:hypothetical protein